MAMNLISAMKERIKSSGTSKKDVFYVAADSKRRIRFLQELDTGYEFKFHTHWERGINALCCEHYHQDCPYCADTDENMKESTMYAWNVWDYDANKVVILLFNYLFRNKNYCFFNEELKDSKIKTLSKYIKAN